jgi:hypothetical protein
MHMWQWRSEHNYLGKEWNFSSILICYTNLHCKPKGRHSIGSRMLYPRLLKERKILALRPMWIGSLLEGVLPNRPLAFTVFFFFFLLYLSWSRLTTWNITMKLIFFYIHPYFGCEIANHPIFIQIWLLHPRFYYPWLTFSFLSKKILEFLYILYPKK